MKHKLLHRFFAFSLAAFICAMTLVLGGCGIDFADFSFSFFDDEINIHIPTDGIDSDVIEDGCRQLVSEAEAEISRDVAAFNSSNNGVEIGDDTAAIIQAALSLSIATGGSFDITSASAEELWIGSEAPSEASIAYATAHIDYEKLSLEKISGNEAAYMLKKADPELKISLSEISCGYICEKLGDYLSGQGVAYGVITYGNSDADKSTLVFGRRPSGKQWTAELIAPEGSEDYEAGENVGYVMLDPGCLSVLTADIGEDGYSSVIDPETGKPVNNEVLGVAVIAKNTIDADMLARALLILGYDETMNLYESGAYVFEAVFITTRGVLMTTNFGGNFWQNTAVG